MIFLGPLPKALEAPPTQTVPSGPGTSQTAKSNEPADNASHTNNTAAVPNPAIWSSVPTANGAPVTDSNATPMTTDKTAPPAISPEYSNPVVNLIPVSAPTVNGDQVDYQINRFLRQVFKLMLEYHSKLIIFIKPVSIETFLKVTSKPKIKI